MPSSIHSIDRSMLISGGAGFIGVNAACYFAKRGWRVTLLDNLSRRGARINLEWLHGQLAQPPAFERIDVCDRSAVEAVVGAAKADVLLHLAGQVAVTTSVRHPRADFETNALGTFNLLEALRIHSPETFFINASTNKVYGKLSAIAVVERNDRYEYRDLATGIDERQPLDFHSPYGCSKGVADQYSIDYARIYGLRTVSLRQSCIYGPRQFGVEDQGWVAWFTIAAVLDRPITIYGDGKQIRDVLYVDDLLRAYEAAIRQQDSIAGQAFNIGGGPDNTLSLLELLAHLRETLKKDIALHWDAWRSGDQAVFVCDVGKAKEKLGWQPRIGTGEGVQRLSAWVGKHQALFAGLC